MFHRAPTLVPVSARKLALLLVASLAAALSAGAQSVRTPQAPTGGVATGMQASASIAEQPPVIDGKDADAVWQTATPITEFRVFDPKEDGDPSFPTEAKIAYDARNIYVFVRMFDPHPDSIVSLL